MEQEIRSYLEERTYEGHLKTDWGRINGVENTEKMKAPQFALFHDRKNFGGWK